MIQYQYFHRNFVLRVPNQIIRPPLPKIDRFELPTFAMVHYVSPSATNPWPSADLLYYAKNVKPIRIFHHTTLIETKGNPKLLPGDINAKIRAFRDKNPRFRPAIDIDAMKRDPRTIITHNYGLLPLRYRYMRNLFSYQNRWSNIFATLFHSIGSNIKEDYHQYLEFTLPAKLPAISTLNRATAGWSAQNIGIFNSYELLLLLHIWIWLGEQRHTGLIAKYMPDVSKVKLILRESDRFCIIDLAILESWRKPSRHDKTQWELNKQNNPDLAPLPKGQWNPNDLQRVFLRMLMSVMEVRNTDLPEHLEDEPTETIDTGVGGANIVTDDIDVDATTTKDDKVVVGQGITNDGEIDELAAYANYDSEEDRLKLITVIDKDLDILEITSREEGNAPPPVEYDDTEESTEGPEEVESVEPVSVDAPREPTFFPDSHQAAFIEQCNRAANNNSITAAEYRRLLDNSTRFDNIPAPLGADGTLESFIDVKHEDVAMVDVPKVPDQPTIFDKSMLSSSLLGIDQRYSEHVFQKDVAGMVSGIRSAGVMINDYQVTEKEDITGSHFEYKISVKPIEGTSSTLLVKIPKVDQYGQFNVGGTPYVLRRQRIDVPIRKIGPDQIAFTSYYGKVFVDRSERRVNDWGKWIRNAIMAKGLASSDTTVTNLVPGNGFLPSVKAPRVFTAVAMGFRSFTLQMGEKAFHCNFDMKDIHFSTTEPKMVLVGLCDSTGEQLWMGFDDNLYISDGHSLKPTSSIEELLELNAIKAPVEFAELKIFGKHVPVGVVLGYLLGFEATLALIKPESMRTVPTGKRINLVDDEWAISFDDKSYVFSRRDRLATMVFGGWRDFNGTTTRFPADEFNKKDVYFNLFEEKKLGVRYLRELDLLEQMFVDQITKKLLEQMHEPTVFTKLMVRGCELLCSDEHPNSQDTRFMRIRSYERFAGAVYTELVRSIRVHNSRPGKHNHGIELNPYAVWIGIQQDPAKDQVSEINPIQQLKENEAVTYSGTGGRGSRSMVKGTRIFHKNDMGVISESTVDSSDVAINMFMSANPQFDSLRGTTKDFNYEEHGATSLLSTTALVSPGSVKDDQIGHVSWVTSNCYSF